MPTSLIGPLSRALSLCCCLCGFATQVWAEETVLPPMTVTGQANAPPPGAALYQDLPLDAPHSAPAADGAEGLRQVPGLAAGRLGGHGLELTVRGLRQDRLNVLLDGAYLFGGCPNRIDRKSVV